MIAFSFLHDGHVEEEMGIDANESTCQTIKTKTKNLPRGLRANIPNEISNGSRLETERIKLRLIHIIPLVDNQVIFDARGRVILDPLGDAAHDSCIHSLTARH